MRRERLALVGLGMPGELTHALLAERTIGVERVGAYLDYVEAAGPDRAQDWLAADLRVSDAVAIDRIAELVSTGADWAGLAESVAAVVRATGRSAPDALAAA